MGQKLGFNELNDSYNGLKGEVNKEKQASCKEILPQQNPRRVVLEYILSRLDYNSSFCCYSVYPSILKSSLSSGGFLTLYSLFLLILALHLLIT